MKRTPPPPSKLQIETYKRAACGLAAHPYQRAKPINLPSNATAATRGRPPAFLKILARPSALRAGRLPMPLPFLNYSALALFAQRTRIPTSSRCIGFCVIWVCISLSSSSYRVLVIRACARVLYLLGNPRHFVTLFHEGYSVCCRLVRNTAIISTFPKVLLRPHIRSNI